MKLTCIDPSILGSDAPAIHLDKVWKDLKKHVNARTRTVILQENEYPGDEKAKKIARQHGVTLLEENGTYQIRGLEQSCHNAQVAFMRTAAKMAKASASIAPVVSGEEVWTPPPTWESEEQDVYLDTESDEFGEIQELLQESLPKATVRSIRRIQLPSWYQLFEAQIKEVREELNGKEPTRKLLFYGPSNNPTSLLSHPEGWTTKQGRVGHYGSGLGFSESAFPG